MLECSSKFQCRSIQRCGVLPGLYPIQYGFTTTICSQSIIDTYEASPDSCSGEITSVSIGSHSIMTIENVMPAMYYGVTSVTMCTASTLDDPTLAVSSCERKTIDNHKVQLLSFGSFENNPFINVKRRPLLRVLLLIAYWWTHRSSTN